ncbi:MAG: hypothetical protein JSV61_03165 [Anaerolineales bacterium]|nr:MAG: hypothetical protein JSV61_03165 [Anaerolineales bacterium]
MNPTEKLKWLKRVLLLKIIAVLFVWGLPALTGPASLLRLFGVSLPEDPFFLRTFGAVSVGLTLLYWYAYREPIRNRDIVKYAVFDNSLSTLAILFIALTSGLSSWFFWVSGALTAFFAAAFWVLIPQEI